MYDTAKPFATSSVLQKQPAIVEHGPFLPPIDGILVSVRLSGDVVKIGADTQLERSRKCELVCKNKRFGIVSSEAIDSRVSRLVFRK